MTPTALIDSFYDAYNRHLVADAIALYATQAEHHEVAQGRHIRGRETIGAGLSTFLASFPDAHWLEQRRVVAPDAVAVAYRLTGTLAAPMGPFREVGARLDLEGMHLFEIRCDQIVSSSDYWDASTFSRQMATTD